MRCNEKNLQQLMKDIEAGKIQLPDFQRDWVWDDYRIKALIASIISNFPIGAAMFLEYGNPDIQFKYREIENAPKTNVIPSDLVLDGQQRLTSIYNAMYQKGAVKTVTDKKKTILRYYYLDIVSLCNGENDTLDCILSIPETKKVTENFGKDVKLDLSNREYEYANHMYPVNLIFDTIGTQQWQQGYSLYHQFNAEIMNNYFAFYNNVIAKMLQYDFPVITLDKNTPREAVCQVFEQVNTGGVSLTVFELVTAIFAMDNFQLRDDWRERKEKYFDSDILSVVTESDFLIAVTLISNYFRFKNEGKAVSCKKKDVLKLSLTEYQTFADKICNGFVTACNLLNEERIFSEKDLPYSTQLIPLAVISALLEKEMKTSITKDKIKRWYWCGVMGELYGGANETRYVNDVVGVLDWIKNDGEEPKTIKEAYFNPTRLLGLQSRLSAAYKGIMALLLKNGCKDFISGADMDFTVYKKDSIDIHHIFPQDYCIKQKLDRTKWNSIVNKTPLTYSTNREIGGAAPNIYISRIEEKMQVLPQDLDTYLSSHLIDIGCIRNNDFQNYFLHRAAMLLDLIGKAMGKPIESRDSKEIQESFGGSLLCYIYHYDN